MANGSNGGGGHLHAINRNKGRIVALEAITGPIPSRTIVTQKSDFGVAVGGVITLIPFELYVLNAAIDLGTDVLEGQTIAMEGDVALSTILTTNSSSALFTSTGNGFIQLRNILAQNKGGPLIDAPLGATPNLSVLVLDTVRFNGDQAGDNTGIGTIGKVDGASLVIITNCFFFNLANGLEIDGVVDDIIIENSQIGARLGVAAFTGVEILPDAELDITVIDTLRFLTQNAADRCVNFSSSATYASPVRVRGCTTRGPGTFVDAAGLQKTDPDFIASDCEGTTAPVDSQFAGNATLLGNAVETVIATQSVPVPIGNGAASHELFNGGAFVERFALSGAETQLQKFTYTGRRTRTFAVDLHCQLTRAGGGSVLVELAIVHEGTPVPDSVTVTEVGNTATAGYTATVLELEPGDELTLEIANNTSDANLVVNSGTWSMHIV